jgi:hypothetical protein
LTKRATFSILAAALLAAVSSSDLIAADPRQQIAVVVNATADSTPGNQFFAVDTTRNDVVKDIEKALRKSSDLLLTKRQSGEPTPVTIILGVKNACVASGADARPDLPASAAEMFWVIDADYAVASTNTGTATRPARYVRSFRGTGRDRPSAVDMVAKDLIAWVAANRSTLLAGK